MAGSAMESGAESPSGPYPIAGPPDAPLPDRIGRFLVTARLGSGAFGTVYRASDPTLDRDVALKVPHPDFQRDERAVARFLREAKAAARLRHPHIVTVFEAGSDADSSYIASAFIPGRSLAEALDDGPFDPCRAARIIATLADALYHAHEQGIVHRDVKPANVLLDADDRPNLTDFGLARLAASNVKLTKANSILGTPAYLSPEQAAGKSDEAQPTSDQYSLGVAFYELLCGHVPFAGPMEVVIFHTLHTPPPPLRAERPEVPEELEAICLKALAKRPEDRFASCRELARHLGRWLAGRRTPPQAFAGTVAIVDGAAVTAPETPGPPGLPATIAGEPTGTGPPSLPAGRRPPPPRRLIGASIAALAALLSLLLSVVIYVKTDNGTVRIELSDANATIRVQVDGDTISIDGFEKPIRLRTGEHTLTVTGQDVETRSQSFTVRRASSDLLKVELVPKSKAADPPALAIEPPAEARRRPRESERAAATGADTPTGPRDEPGFVALYRAGDPLKQGWDHIGKGAITEGSPGMLVTQGGLGLLRHTKTAFGDFILRLEWKVTSPLANSGIDIRISDLVSGPEETYDRCYEVQICDDPRDAGTGAIFAGLPGNDGGIKRPDRPSPTLWDGNWNRMEITARGQEFRVVVNGVEINRFTGSRALRGYIGLQNHGGRPGEVQFRNIRIKSLDGEPDDRAAEFVTTTAAAIRLRRIPAGEFLMGSPDSDVDASADEKPQHSVRITEPFYLGVTEVTRGQFRQFVDETGYRTEAETNGEGGNGWNEEKKTFERAPRFNWLRPGFEQTDEHPVVNVSWNDAMAFCRWLSGKERRTYRLPTEAEWEYACRAGTETRFSFGGDENVLGLYAWFAANSASETHPVGLKRPNSLGLYDMHGNAWEWCLDGYDADYYKRSPRVDPPGPFQPERRVIRSGRWRSPARDARSAFRAGCAPAFQWDDLGFRVVGAYDRPPDAGSPNRSNVGPSGEIRGSTPAEVTGSSGPAPPRTGMPADRKPPSSPVVPARAAESTARDRAGSQTARPPVSPPRDYSGLIRAADQAIREKNWDLARESLAACDEHERSWDWAYCRHLCDRTTGSHADALILAHGVGDRAKVSSWHPRGVWGLAFSPDSGILATNGGTIVNLWDTASGRLVRRLGEHSDGGFNVAFSPDGRRVAGTSEDGILKIWKVSSGESVGTINPRGGPLYGVAFSGDGRRVFTSGKFGRVSIWDSTTTKPIDQLRGHDGFVQCLAISRDGRLLASGGLHDNTVKVWNAQTRALVSNFKNDDRIQDVTFSPDGRRLAAADWHGTIRILDASSGRELRAIRGQRGRVSAVGFSHDGKRVASGFTDEAGVALWDVATGERLFTLTTSTGTADVAFSPDGRKLAASGWDGDVRLWDATAVAAQEARGDVPSTSSAATKK
jgi:formylglycine-generating enzyme required for sulfatase activity/WD40 repeat protein